MLRKMAEGLRPRLFSPSYPKSSSAAAVIFALLCLCQLPAQAVAQDVQAVEQASDDEVCYDQLGCFSRLPPFDNAGGLLPDPPEAVATELRLYTPGRGQPELLDYRYPQDVRRCKYDSSLPTKVIIHGFGNSLDETAWISDMRSAFEEKSQSNIILVGWNTMFPNYPQAVANTRLVGRVVATVIKILRRAKGLDPSRMHMIGHSLGAHVASYVGHLLGSAVARITGLDPAGPGFGNHPADVRLDPTDARFVDVIHSNGHPMDLRGGFGMKKRAGHVDFYPNGGAQQPGCTDGVGGGFDVLLEDLFAGDLSELSLDVAEAIGCSHGRSSEIFTESVRANSSCRFTSYPCSSYAQFEQGKCVTCGPNGCNTAGLEADATRARGLQFFQTMGESPLCGQSYSVTVVPGGKANAMNGNILVDLEGDLGVGGAVLVSGAMPMKQKEPFTRVVAIPKNLGQLSRVILRYRRHNIMARRQMIVENVTVEALGGGRRFATTSRNMKLSINGDLKEKVIAEV